MFFLSFASCWGPIFFFLCLALLEANNLALNVDLNSENSLMSFIQSHLWKGTYKQAEEYNLGVINGVCCFSGRKFFQVLHPALCQTCTTQPGAPALQTQPFAFSLPFQQ